MTHLLLAGAVLLTAGQKTDMTGVWMTDSSQAYVFYGSDKATYIDGSQFADMANLKPVPNGTILGYWARRDLPRWPVGYRDRPDQVPSPSGLVEGLTKTDQGTWRLSDLKRTNRGDLDEATLTIQDAKPSLAVTKKIFYAFGLEEVWVDGRYLESSGRVILDIGWKGSKLEGSLTSYGIEYAVSGKVDRGFYYCTLINPGNGAQTGFMTIAWNPTAGCLQGIKEGRSMPADRVLVSIASLQDKQKAPIVRTLVRKK
ncbi:MAG TPA: hypothetical protein PLH94_02840 [Fimbriimonadaceae bacterium]|nr:hypothetical protein [Fimbriimonadaceae bacterium]